MIFIVFFSNPFVFVRIKNVLFQNLKKKKVSFLEQKPPLDGPRLSPQGLPGGNIQAGHNLVLFQFSGRWHLAGQACLLRPDAHRQGREVPVGWHSSKLVDVLS